MSKLETPINLAEARRARAEEREAARLSPRLERIVANALRAGFRDRPDDDDPRPAA